MTEQWQELKETIIELRDNDGTSTQQEICKFLANYMDVLEKQMQEPCEDIAKAFQFGMALGFGEKHDGMDKIIAEIKKVITPQAKTGHWIYEKRKRLMNETDEGAEYITDYWCKCSNCGGDFGYIKMKDAFCKYCGAKMVQESEGLDEG